MKKRERKEKGEKEGKKVGAARERDDENGEDNDRGMKKRESDEKG